MAAFTLCLLSIVGCSRSSLCTVTGSVSFNGQPVKDGSIRFFPIEGTEGNGAVTTIQNGQFHTNSESKLRSGKYMVQITATRKTGRTIKPKEVMPGDSGSPIEEEVQIIPPKYNTKSELRVELHAGENAYDQKLAM